MPKSKQRKNHRQKSQARSQKIKIEKNRAQKLQTEFIMNLIKQEQERGLFENNPTIPPIGPMIDGPLINGPIMDSSIIEGSVIEGPSI